MFWQIYINILSNFLDEYNCDKTLFNQICSYKLSLKQSNIFVEYPRVETSIKYMKVMHKHKLHIYKSMKRYTLPIKVSEFNKYLPEWKHKLFELIGFKYSEYKNKCDQLSENDDIIFGLDGDAGIGKIYFDKHYKIISYETNLLNTENTENTENTKNTTKNTKTYIKQSNDIIHVLDKNNKFLGYHIRCTNWSMFDNIYWIGYFEEYITHYIRISPYLNVFIYIAELYNYIKSN